MVTDLAKDKAEDNEEENEEEEDDDDDDSSSSSEMTLVLDEDGRVPGGMPDDPVRRRHAS
jgi:hypothetical protein